MKSVQYIHESFKEDRHPSTNRRVLAIMKAVAESRPWEEVVAMIEPRETDAPTIGAHVRFRRNMDPKDQAVVFVLEAVRDSFGLYAIGNRNREHWRKLLAIADELFTAISPSTDIAELRSAYDDRKRKL